MIFREKHLKQNALKESSEPSNAKENGKSARRDNNTIVSLLRQLHKDPFSRGSGTIN